MPTSFISKEPQIEDYWRALILFGRNVASYKFALAKTLLGLKPRSGSLIKLDELAPVFSKHVSEHIKHSNKQGTSPSSKFLEACRDYNSGNLNPDELTKLTVRYGFSNVIDAFHVVGNESIEKKFYTDERRENGGIRVTDEFAELLHSHQSANLPHEVEARWCLVETAWELNMSRSLVSIDFDSGTESLFTIDRNKERKPVTGSRDALNGYQKGRCFYCFSEIQISESSTTFPDVDHFFPNSLKQQGFGSIIDGIWNLVLSCQLCNRGKGGKFARVPSVRLLERLHKRNEYLISSHHPLRQTLIQQTGASPVQRIGFLNDFHDKARTTLIHLWEPIEEFKADF